LNILLPLKLKTQNIAICVSFLDELKKCCSYIPLTCSPISYVRLCLIKHNVKQNLEQLGLAFEAIFTLQEVGTSDLFTTLCPLFDLSKLFCRCAERAPFSTAAEGHGAASIRLRAHENAARHRVHPPNYGDPFFVYASGVED
jgi:hypothetical protein